MRPEILQDETLVRYLLDEMTDAERAEIEERFFQDDSFFEEMLAAEDELRYEYQQDRLSGQRRGAFEKKFLSTPEEFAKSVFAEAFLQTTAELAAAGPAAEPEKASPAARASWWQSIAAFFDFGGPAMRYGLAAAVVLLACGLAFLLFKNARLEREMADLESGRAEEVQRQEQILAEKQRQQADLESRLAAEKQQRDQDGQRIREIEVRRAQLEREITEARRKINQQRQNPDLAKQTSTPPPPPRQNTVLALALSPGLFTRGEGQGAARVSLSPGVRSLRLNLLLKNADEYKNYRGVLKTLDEDTEVWSGPPAASGVRGKGAKRSVSFEIPARVFKRGDYELTLFGITANGAQEEINTYYFGVLK